ncbi:MAG: class II D-tagatose-bisphosphate aldolase, non-catalytic subunit [Hyphomicrobiales bacterium]|nr:class II D-tagatose-bisphosphate aldolase, non-catalytic subunit [Hyphomicrobiales bacterium]
MNIRTVTMALAIAATGASPAIAQDGAVFDPLASCTEMLAEDSGIPPVAIGFWVFGYFDAKSDEAHFVTVDRLETLLDAMRTECASAPDTLMTDLAGLLVGEQAKQEPTVAEDGRNLLMRFFDPSEDHGALTLSLKPSPADIRAVYGEPLASALINTYEEMYQPGAVIRPKPEHKQLLTTFTTTGRLKAGDPVLDDFPGGYDGVRPFIVGDVPIARFKFVEQGETLGLAFDGLIFVNDHWVLMPKPWRSLPD